MVFIDRTDIYYDSVSLAPCEDDIDPSSPFIHKTPEECYDLLVQLREDTESEIITNYFAIMDERSAQDNTVLLVTAGRDLDGDDEGLTFSTVRATFKASALALMLYNTGHSSVDEDLERAERERDGVYRGIWSKIR